jgi:hypothetical protein
MAWTIEIGQLPIVNGIASHAFWALRNNGVVVAEWQGLAPRRYTPRQMPQGLPLRPRRNRHLLAMKIKEAGA